MMEQSWWYRKDEEQRGPFSTSQIQALQREGVLSADTLVAAVPTGGAQPSWRPVIEVEALWLSAQHTGASSFEGPTPGTLEPTFHPPVAIPSSFEPTLLVLEPLPPMAPGAATAAGTWRTEELPLAGPWRRFFARVVDASLFGYLGGLLLGAIAANAFPAFAMWLQSPDSRVLVPAFVLPLSLGMEAVIAGLFGATLGKWLLGVQVTTTSGARPSFGQFAQRLSGLYWAALGFGLVFVNIFTMGRQYWLLKNRRSTGYDMGRFRISARPLTTPRIVGAVAVVLAAVGINQGMLHEQRMSRKDYNAGFEWRNPVSGTTASVPPGWLYANQENQTGDPLYTFSSDKLGVVAIFAMEESLGHMSIEEYRRIWSSTVSSDILIDERFEMVSVKGHRTLQAHGAMTNNATRRVHATLLKSGDQVWRFIVVGLPGREADGILTNKLREALISTVPERPDTAAPTRRAPAGKAI